LIKPFVFAELLARIRALVRRQYGKQSSVINVGDLEVDTTARRGRRSGKVIDLSAKEYPLLEVLAFRKNESVTRTESVEHVYDCTSTAESNVVDVFIRLIRKKIEGPGMVPLIHTYRGQGYLLGLKE